VLNFQLYAQLAHNDQLLCLMMRNECLVMTGQRLKRHCSLIDTADSYAAVTYGCLLLLKMFKDTAVACVANESNHWPLLASSSRQVASPFAVIEAAPPSRHHLTTLNCPPPPPPKASSGLTSMSGWWALWDPPCGESWRLQPGRRTHHAALINTRKHRTQSKTRNYATAYRIQVANESRNVSGCRLAYSPLGSST
jgi:hypothetical protein